MFTTIYFCRPFFNLSCTDIFVSLCVIVRVDRPRLLLELRNGNLFIITKNLVFSKMLYFDTLEKLPHEAYLKISFSSFVTCGPYLCR